MRYVVKCSGLPLTASFPLDFMLQHVSTPDQSKTMRLPLWCCETRLAGTTVTRADVHSPGVPRLEAHDTSL